MVEAWSDYSTFQSWKDFGEKNIQTSVYADTLILCYNEKLCCHVAFCCMIAYER